MDKKSLFLVLGGYILWGVLPLYWGLLGGLDSIFILANRIIFSAIFTLLLLLVLKKYRELIAVFKNKSAMKYLIPASITITINWGLYIWAVGHGHVMDASIGYYINPLAVFLCGVFIFKERCSKIEIGALLLAAVGVVLFTVQIGEFPVVALVLAASFALYGTMKKFAHVDGIISVCIETLVMLPACLLFFVFSDAVPQSLAVITPLQMALCVGAGVVTALPLILYTRGVNNIPLITMGFLQYICPTLMLVIGVLQGEKMDDKLGALAFIWAGLALFTVGLWLRERKARALQVQAVSKEGAS